MLAVEVGDGASIGWSVRRLAAANVATAAAARCNYEGEADLERRMTMCGSREKIVKQRKLQSGARVAKGAFLFRRWLNGCQEFRRA
jgi:hypothetical protein